MSRAKTKDRGDSYRASQANRDLAKRKAERDIGLIPKPKKPTMRGRAIKSLEFFVRRYFNHWFPGPFFNDQLEQIKETEQAILNGTSKAYAAMRGGGKTSIARAAVIWAILNGHSNYIVLIGATGADSNNNLNTIKGELESNELLIEDYPEICVPAKALEGSSRRCVGQTCNLIRTNIEWKMNKIILPDIKKDMSEGDWVFKYDKKTGLKAIIECKSMDGAIRGLNTRGSRPDLVILDDIETRESVKSDSQTQAIRVKIDTDISGLAGKKKSLTIIAIGTIMAEMSVMAELTDAKQRPSYSGKRYSYVKKWPKAEEIWKEYMDIRADTEFRGPKDANKFYLDNKEAMDEEVEVAWVDGYDKNLYSSAIEQIYASWIDKRDNGMAYIACECQNDPSMLLRNDGSELTAEQIYQHANGFNRCWMPPEVRTLTGFIDVHGSSNYLYWSLIGWDVERTGYIIDYGRFPETQTLGERYKGTIESQISRGLIDFSKFINANKYTTDSGLVLDPVFGVDSGWGQTSPVVYSFCRNTNNYFATKGSSVGFRDFDKIGDKSSMRGDGWRELKSQNVKFTKLAYLFDANRYKRRVFDAFLLPIKERGTITIFGRAAEHVEFIRHLLSEYPKVIVEKGTGLETELFERYPSRPNHWLDTVVGAMVIAAIRGVGQKTYQSQQATGAVKNAKALMAKRGRNNNVRTGGLKSIWE